MLHSFYVSDVLRTEYRPVSQRNVDESMMGKSRHSSNSGRLLAATQKCSRNEQAGVLAPEASLYPLLASLIPESLELGREVSIASRNTKRDTIKALEVARVVQNGNVRGLGGSMHLF